MAWVKMVATIRIKDVVNWLKDRFFRAQQMGAIIRNDQSEYLRSCSLMFASDHRKLGHQIGDSEVDRILNTPDGYYLGNVTPLRYLELKCRNRDSFRHTQIAVMAVREEIRRRLGIALPHMPIRELEASWRAGEFSNPLGKMDIK